MPEISLAAEAGRPTGSRPARRLRAAGKIPGVVYGHGIEPIPVLVDGRALRAALSGPGGTNALVSLRVDGTAHLTMTREIQRHPVRGTVSHVDFLIVRRDEVVSAEVPIALAGEAEEVHRGDGIVEQQLFALAIRALPANIPDSIEVDVSGLAIGDTIRVGDLRLAQGVEVDTDGDHPVVVGHPPQVRPADLGEVEAAEEGAEQAEEAGAGAEAGQAAGEPAGSDQAGSGSPAEPAGA